MLAVLAEDDDAVRDDELIDCTHTHSRHNRRCVVGRHFPPHTRVAKRGLVPSSGARALKEIGEIVIALPPHTHTHSRRMELRMELCVIIVV